MVLKSTEKKATGLNNSTKELQGWIMVLKSTEKKVAGLNNGTKDHQEDRYRAE